MRSGTIALIDYGMGNLRSVEKAFEYLGVKVVRTDDPAVVAECEGVVLPGVGAFGDAMARLRSSGLDHAVVDTIHANKHFLGICLGLQLLFSSSQEGGDVPGLDIVKGKVVHLPKGLKTPHIGWNTVCPVTEGGLMDGVGSDSRYYFVHSYYVAPDDPEWTAVTTEYGITYTSAIEKGNVFACQFHPEKSGELGLEVLRRFADRLSA